MTWAVAAQFSFTESEMLAMPIHRLRYWYEGHVQMWKKEE